MRTYAPADTERRPRPACSTSRRSPAGVVHHAVLPARDGRRSRDFPDWLDPRIVAGPRGARHRARRTPTRPRRSRRSTPAQDVVVVTPTASGKTLCYALPVLQAIAEDPAARALFLFPTKALGQDQVAEFGELSAAAGLTISAVDLRRRHAGPDPVGDPGGRPGRRHQPGHAPLGDPAPPHQVVPAVRAAPGHRHRRAAHVPRRVRQPRRERPPPAAPASAPTTAADPVIVCCSATIGNPAELARDADRPAGAARSTATARPPASATSCSSTRRSSTRRAARAAPAVTLAQRWALPFLRAGRQTDRLRPRRGSRSRSCC
mgnify:CR=1 FL=1